AYALGTVVGIGAAGGYRPARRLRRRPVWIGTAVGLLLVAAASFFVKDIAFSRFVVAVAYPSAALVLVARRLAAGAHAGRRRGVRRALLVGRAAEAGRLRQMLERHPDPPFALAGYVEPDRRKPSRRNGEAAVPRLGTLRHLRDLVRLQRIDDV